MGLIYKNLNELHLNNFCIYWLEVHSEGPFNKALDEQQIVPFFSINTNIDFDHHPSKKVARNLEGGKSSTIRSKLV